jgi:hypothetical protein
LDKKAEICRFQTIRKRPKPPPQAKTASRAQWWAALAPEQRDTLQSEFPNRTDPHGLQCMCKEKAP